MSGDLRRLEATLTLDDPQRLLGWIERLYALTEPRRFAEHALLVLLDATDAPAGYVVFRPASGGAVGGAVRGLRTRRIRAGLATVEMADAVHTRLAHPDAVQLAGEGAGLAGPFGGLPVISLRLFHTEADCASLWVLARQRPFGELARRRLDALERAVTYAGDLMLPRLPGGPAGFYTRAPVGPGTDPPHATTLDDLLSGLSPLAADCACLAARGYTNRQISAYLRVGQGAVARHLSVVYRHLGIDGRHQLDAQRLLERPKPAPRLHRSRGARRQALPGQATKGEKHDE